MTTEAPPDDGPVLAASDSPTSSRDRRDRFIVHVDMDSFYASAEARRDPGLKDQPVIIGADPNQGKGRGVVLTCNYEARRFGVKSGMPISEAWRLCPQAVYLPPDFGYYDRLSTDFMQIIRNSVDRVEQVSIDEAFVDLTGVTITLQDALRWVSALKAELWMKTGLTCSVGLAENKSAAKIATDMQKPDGITVIPPGLTTQRLAPLPIAVIPGVGAKTEGVLRDRGVTKVGDLQRLGPDAAKRMLGRSGIWIWEVANGVEREEVREHAPKSLSTEMTFQQDAESWESVESAIVELSAELAKRAANSRTTFRRVGVKIRFRGFETHTRETRLPAQSDSGELIRQEALSLVANFRKRKEPVRLVGVRVSELGEVGAVQTSMNLWVEKKGGG